MIEIKGFKSLNTNIQIQTQQLFRKKKYLQKYPFWNNGHTSWQPRLISALYFLFWVIQSIWEHKQLSQKATDHRAHPYDQVCHHEQTTSPLGRNWARKIINDAPKDTHWDFVGMSIFVIVESCRNTNRIHLSFLSMGCEEATTNSESTCVLSFFWGHESPAHFHLSTFLMVQNK